MSCPACGDAIEIAVDDGSALCATVLCGTCDAFESFTVPGNSARTAAAPASEAALVSGVAVNSTMEE